MENMERMNFFDGFFTTADDWEAEQKYHIEKLKLHNRGLHTPGILRGAGDEFELTVQGLGLTVSPGVAMDKEGREIYLARPKIVQVGPGISQNPQLVFVAIRWHEVKDRRQPSLPSSSVVDDYTRWVPEPDIQPGITKPDNLEWIELARVKLDPDVKELRLPVDPANPGPNEIDTRFRVFAGSAAVLPPRMPPDERSTIVRTMRGTRTAFGRLALKYATPSAPDVRQAALMTEFMTHADSLLPEHVRSVLRLLHDVERDVYQEIASIYPALTGQTEYKDYKEAVDVLHGLFSAESSLARLLDAQVDVAEKASELTKAVVPVHPPIAIAGPKQVVTTDGSEATVLLDAANSFAFGGRRIAVYRWDLVRSESAPIVQAVAIEASDHADPDQALVTLSVQLLAVPGRSLTYHWDELLPTSIDPNRVLSKKIVELPANRPAAPAGPAVSAPLAVQDVRVEALEQTNPDEATVRLSVDLRAASAGDVTYTYTWNQVQPGQADPSRIITRRVAVELPSAPPLAAPALPVQPLLPVQQPPAPPVQPQPAPPAQPQPVPPALQQPAPPVQPQPVPPVRGRRGVKPKARHVRRLTIETGDDEAIVDLDASQSSAAARRTISTYLWQKIN